MEKPDNRGDDFEGQKTNRVSNAHSSGSDCLCCRTSDPQPISPIPGVKLGLANIITVYTVYRHRAREVFLIIVVRIFLGSLLSGNMMAFMYSIAGGMMCLVEMLLLKRLLSMKYIWVWCFTISVKPQWLVSLPVGVCCSTYHFFSAVI